MPADYAIWKNSLEIVAGAGARRCSVRCQSLRVGSGLLVGAVAGLRLAAAAAETG